ncbi:RNA polymerase sigma factor [Streptosporangium sp. CA-115845]|uniref:RNA polymerase sigma factor n=1 Tax=Streptosporangium sp. CA-115845 TaxID=3240071 RepID=UPI003D904B76
MIKQPTHTDPPSPPPHPRTTTAAPTRHELTDRYGAALLDYALTWRAVPDLAADTVRDALTLATRHPHRIPSPDQLRAWLYALTRLLAHNGDGTHAFTTAPLPHTPQPATHGHPYAPTGTEPPISGRQLARDALSALDRGDRELLELALRHDLPPHHISAITQRPLAETTAALTAAEDLIEAWASVIRQAGKLNPTCPQAATLATQWIDTPSRGLRTKVRMHVGQCATCGKAAHITIAAATLMAHLPITALTPELHQHLITPADPPATDPPWSDTGFPHQPDQPKPQQHRAADPALQGFQENDNSDFWNDPPPPLPTDTDAASTPATTASNPAPRGAHRQHDHPTPLAAALTQLRRLQALINPGQRRALRTTALGAASLLICLTIWSWTGQPPQIHNASAQAPHTAAFSQDPLPLESAPPPPLTPATTAPIPASDPPPPSTPSPSPPTTTAGTPPPTTGTSRPRPAPARATPAQPTVHITPHPHPRAHRPPSPAGPITLHPRPAPPLTPPLPFPPRPPQTRP